MLVQNFKEVDMPDLSPAIDAYGEYVTLEQVNWSRHSASVEKRETASAFVFPHPAWRVWFLRNCHSPLRGANNDQTKMGCRGF